MARAVVPRSADSLREGRPTRGARFVRSPTVGCRIRRTPSFRTLAGECGSERQAGLPFLSLTGLFPSHPYRHGIVYSFTDDSAGNVWVSHQEGLFHLFQERVVERIPWARLGRRQPASALLHDAVQGGLWLGFRDGGVAYFKDGQLRTSVLRRRRAGRGNGPRFLHRWPRYTLGPN